MHDHSHHAPSSTNQRLLIALAIIFFFAIVEALGGWWANSLALLSDAGHMFADSLALILAAVAAWVAKKPPNYKHSFGFGRAEIIGASLSSLLLIAVMISIIVEAVQRLMHGQQAANGILIIAVAFIGLLANLIAAYVLSKGEQDLNVRAAVLHVLSDTLGSIAALVAGAVIYFSGWLPIDAILSLFISGLVLIATMRLLKETFAILMESVPQGLNLKEIGLRMAETERIKAIHDLHIWRLSSNQTMLSAHVEISDLNDWPLCLKRLQILLQEEFDIDHITLQPEINESVLYQLPDS